MSTTYAEVGSTDTPFSISMDSEEGEVKTAGADITKETDDVQPIQDADGGGADADDKDAGDEDAGGDEGGEEIDLSEEDLGAYDPEDPDQVARYDQAFQDEDGSLKDATLSSLFWKRRDAGEEGLPEGVYAYLETKGIKKATVKQIEAMAETEQDAKANSVTKHDEALFTEAGGADALQAALAWGKAGGYTKEQQARFNKITSGKDLEAKKEAVAALMARYNKANPPKRPKVPGRDATKGGGGKPSSALPFKDKFEMRQMRDSLKPNDHAGWALWRKRRAASQF
jgi:hypothetical protein